jgi:hypothetical protein
MFRVVCVVVSMFAKSDFGGTNLVSVLSKLGKQGGRRISRGVTQIQYNPCYNDHAYNDILDRAIIFPAPIQFSYK